MMRGSNEKMTRSSLVVTHHDRRGSCVVMTADGQESSPTAVRVCTVMCRFITTCNKNVWQRTKVSQNGNVEDGTLCADADHQNILEPPSAGGYSCSDPISNYYLSSRHTYD